MVEARKKGTILIVEDDVGVANLERRRLERAGYLVLSAETAEQALTQLRQTGVDLILLDYRLPGNVDGLDFYSQVRGAGYDLPVILVTGFSNEATVIRALRAGVRDFVTKSLEYLDYLPEAVDHVLKQVQTEHQLVESEARLAAIIKSAKEAIILVEKDETVTLFNPAAEQMFRCPASQALGQPIHRFIPLDVTSRAASLLLGKRGVRPDGSSFPLESSVSEVSLDGRLIFTLMVRDITERHAADRALKLSEERYRLMFEEDLTGDFLATATGQITLGNTALAGILGLDSMAKITSSNLADFLPDPQEFQDILEELKSKKKLDLYEFDMVRQNGETVNILANLIGIFDSQGEFQGCKGYLLDITWQKRAQDVIRRSELQFHQVWDQSLDGMCLIDGQGTIRLVNAAFCRMVGKAQQALEGWQITTAFAADQHHDFLTEFQLKFANRSIEPHLAREFTRWDGKKICLETSNSFLQFPDEPPLLLAITRDVTEQKQLEAMYRQARKMEAVGQLAGGVAHDFNNLLTIITGYCDVLLEKKDLLHRAEEFLREIRKAGDRAAALTRQLLAFSRKQILAPEVLDLNTLVGDMEKMLARLIGEDIDLAASLDPELGKVRVDRGQLEQVVMNLVVNARDAMPTGGKITLETQNIFLDEIYARHRPDIAPGWYALLAVTDSGTGMDETTKARIFEPFFTTKEVGKGTGLGLATVFGVIKQSNGHIDVYSEVGRGTTFKIYLPLAEKPAASPSTLGPKSPVQGSETILLAEDEEGVRQLVGLALRSFGYTILEASNGAEALAICRRHPQPIHLLMTDVVMPQMSGRQLADEVTSLLPSVKILYLSGYTDDAVVRHGLIQAKVAFLQKPFTPTVLARKVRKVLDLPVVG